jgi:hypothetical protein
MFADIQLEIDPLWALHPNWIRKLESLYAEAHPESAITTERLIDFAYQEYLRLTGEP